MYYALRKDCYIRKVGEFGYIKSSGLFNDLVFDKSGQIFLSCLGRNPKSLTELSIEISACFIDMKPEEIINDVKEFFDVLVEDGYAICGKTYQEAINNNVGFNYSDVKQISLLEVEILQLFKQVFIV